MTRPPEAPLSGWFLLALLVGGVLYLVVRAALNERGWGTGIGVGIGSFFALLLPNAAVGLTQDLTCRDGGVVELGDLDGDGNAEVLASEGGAVVVLWDRAGQLEVGPRLLPPAPADADKFGQRAFALADVDGDGRLDVVSWGGGSRSPSYLILHRNTGERRFISTIEATIGNEYLSGAAVADFDGDGDVDVVENGGTDRLVVLINRGDGRFDLTARPRRVGAEKLFPADVDGDGRTDLVLSVGFVSDVVKEPGFLFVRLNRGGFSFSDAQRLAIPRTLLATAELNGDGRADYIVDEFRTMDVLLSRDC